MKKIIYAALFLCASSTYAQQIITDRPSQTESPIAISKGELQIESGLLFERTSWGEGISQLRSVYPTSLFRIGLAERLELRIVNEVANYKVTSSHPLIISTDNSGTENLQIGFKYQITESDAKVVIGAIAHAIVPTGSEEIANDMYGVFSRVNFLYNISNKKNISANLGYNNYSLEMRDGELQRSDDGDLTYTLAYGVGISDRVGMYAEAFGDYVDFDEWENNMDVGMTYLLRENIQLDYSYGWGLNREMNYHSVGISMRFPK